ncbi:MAG: SIS domain-containing protein [Spirochaetaceae bacterium]|jgi:D-sedoheptulose 7-phosphate isomerase|nr:SIS domain-containing protein [Spirochaetaceae bacterium]
MNTVYVQQFAKELIIRYPVLIGIEESFLRSCVVLINAFQSGKKLLVCGNGGSAADADHIVGELMKSFFLERPIDDDLKQKITAIAPTEAEAINSSLQRAYPAIALSEHTALSTAFSNDVNPNYIFAQQVLGYGKAGDVFLGISTSGNAKNVLAAAVVAKAKGLAVIGLTGKSGGKLKQYCDILLNANETETYKVQELHLPIYHCLCLAIERTIQSN